MKTPSWVWTVFAAIIGIFGGILLFAFSDRIDVGRTIYDHESRIKLLEQETAKYNEDHQLILDELKAIHNQLDTNHIEIVQIRDNQGSVLHKLGLVDLSK
jgi:predicted PurR-regulated permease PerM